MFTFLVHWCCSADISVQLTDIAQCNTWYVHVVLWNSSCGCGCMYYWPIFFAPKLCWHAPCVYLWFHVHQSLHCSCVLRNTVSWSVLPWALKTRNDTSLLAILKYCRNYLYLERWQSTGSFRGNMAWSTFTDMWQRPCIKARFTEL